MRVFLRSPLEGSSSLPTLSAGSPTVSLLFLSLERRVRELILFNLSSSSVGSLGIQIGVLSGLAPSRAKIIAVIAPSARQSSSLLLRPLPSLFLPRELPSDLFSLIFLSHLRLPFNLSDCHHRWNDGVEGRNGGSSSKSFSFTSLAKFLSSLSSRFFFQG